MTISTEYKVENQPLIIEDRNKRKKKKLKLERAWNTLTVTLKRKKGSPNRVQATKVKKIPEERINFLSSKYLVSTEKLREKMALGIEELNTYLEHRDVKYGAVIDQAVIDYNTIITNYSVSKKKGGLETLSARRGEGHCVEGLTTDLLMKIVRQSVLKLSKVEGSSQLGVSLRITSKHKWRILAKREVGRLQLINWCGKLKPKTDSPFLIGSGSFGFVHRVEDIANAQLAAMKVAFAKSGEHQELAVQELINEVRKLNFIHRKGLVEGVMAPPSCFFHIRDEETRLTAYTQKLYNLEDVVEAVTNDDIVPENLTKKEGLLILRRLYNGLNSLHRENTAMGSIIHGDIKSDNILVERTAKKEIRCVLGDFGSSKYTIQELIKQKEITNPPFGTVTTPGSFTLTDWNRLKSALKNENYLLWICYQKKRDLYGLTVALWPLLSGEKPYEVGTLENDDFFPKTENNVNGSDEVLDKYGRALTDILVAALSEDPDNRPAIQTILNTIDAELALLDNGTSC